MRFIYFSHQTLQVPRVARQCMVSLCDGIAGHGVETEIVSFTARMHPSEPSHPPFRQLYGVGTSLTSRAYRIPFASVDSESLYVRVARVVLYVAHLLRRLLFSGKGRATFAVARNYSVLAVLIALRPLFNKRLFVIADVHGMPSSRLAHFVHRRVDVNICISRALALDLGERLDIASERLRVAHSGVRPERFDVDMDRDEARQTLELDPNARIVCYTGKVYYRYEEIAYLVEASRDLPYGCQLLVVGGRPDHVEKWREECESRGYDGIRFVSFVSPSLIPLYLRAADLLVLYYSPSPLNHYRSPGKLFEYLASGTPMLACSTRSISEVIRDGENGILVEPYSARDLHAAIERGLGDDALRERIAAGARGTALEYTWIRRGQAFIEAASEVATRRRGRANGYRHDYPHEVTKPIEVS